MSTYQQNVAPIKSLAETFGESTIVDVIADYQNEIPQKQWRIKEICTIGECAMIAGASKSGKSYMGTGIAISVASGRNWLGRFPCERGRVLYLNGENSINDARERFHVCFDAMGVSPADCEKITMVCADGMVKPIQELKDMLIAEIKEKQYALVICDPLYCFFQGSEIDEGDAKAFVSTIKDICRETGCVIICIHHHSKGAAMYRNASNRASGSGMLQRAFSTLLDVSEIDTEGMNLSENQRAYELSGQPRQAPGFKINLIFDFPIWRYDADGTIPDNAINKGRTAKARQNNPNLRKGEELKAALPMAIEEAFQDMAQRDNTGDYVTIGNVVEALHNRGVDTSDRSVSRAIDDGKAPSYRRDEKAGNRAKIRRIDFMNVPESIIPTFA